MKDSTSIQSTADVYSVLKQFYTKIAELFKKDADEPDLPTLRMRYMIDDYSEERHELNMKNSEPV